MVNRKRTAAEAKIDENDLLKVEAPKDPNVPKASSSRPMQGDGGDGNKHTIDSDEEEDMRQEKYDVLDDNEIEGQEDETIEKDGEHKITPFNLKEEREDGDFSAEGDFIWKKTTDIKDAWLDNVDWVKVKEVSKDEQEKQDALDEAEDEAEAAYNELEVYKSVLTLMKPGETVAKSIRRLGGGGGPGQQKMLIQKQRKIAQKLKKKQKLTEEEEKYQKSRDEMKKLTGFADTILTRSGNMEIYEETFEKITFRLKEEKKKNEAAVTDIPKDIDDDDALDMFADTFDTNNQKKKEAGNDSKKSEEKKEEVSSIDFDDEVHWHYRWKDSEDEDEIHGPFNSTKMLQWQESGFFDKGVLVRKVGTTEFLDGKRIDFDLYT